MTGTLLNSILIIFVIVSGTGVQGCTSPYSSFGDNCYYLVTFTKSNWNRSEQFCAGHGGHLVSVTSQNEYDFVQRLIRDTPRARDVWIGLYHTQPITYDASDYEYRQGWQWSDGSPYSFMRWANLEPGPGDQYVRIQSGDWVAVDNHDQPHHFMCEKPGPRPDDTFEISVSLSTTTSSEAPTIAPGPGPQEGREDTDPPSTTKRTLQTTSTVTTTQSTTTSTPSTTETTRTTTTTKQTTTTNTPSTTTTNTPSTTTNTPSTTNTSSTTATTTTSTPSTTTITSKAATTKSSLTSTTTTKTKSDDTSTPRGQNNVVEPLRDGVIDKVIEKPEPPSEKNIGLILGAVLGGLFVVIVGAIICIVAKTSNGCKRKKDDDYVEPLKSPAGPTDEQIVGDILTDGSNNVTILTQNNNNIYIELQERAPQNGHVILNENGNYGYQNANQTNAFQNNAYQNNGYQNNVQNGNQSERTYERMRPNSLYEENVYDSIRQLEQRQPARLPNPYLNS